jgi:tricorn protease
MTLPRVFACLTVLLFAGATGLAQAAGGYARQPAIHGDTVVFTAEGDLWTVPVTGGSARRLTSHPAEESRAAISPDGRWLAFSAAYEGPVEAHVMPLAGGAPRRVSFENARALVLGWSPQGEVLYSAPQASGPSSMRVVAAVDPDTGRRRLLPLADANDALVAADGTTSYVVRFGLALTGDNAVGYRGGALSQLWRFDAGQAEARRIGPQDANIRRPMAWNDRVLVIMDRAGRDNLWSLAADGGDPRPHTQHRDFDVRSASVHGNRVVYQHGADLRLHDLASGEDRALAIALVSDFEQRRERWSDEPLRFLEHAAIAPAGDQAVLTVRGRVALAAVGPRRRVEIAAPPASRLSAAVLSPDGDTVYAIGDGTGEEEIWRFAADGSDDGRALTSDGDTQRLSLTLSPDGTRLAHDDKRGRLWLLDLDSGRNTLLDDGGPDGNEGHAAVVWAPDSRHLAIARATDGSGRTRIALIDTDTGTLDWLTSDRYESGDPAFSADGRWLWFLSQREFRLANRSPWGDRNTGAFFDRRTRIYGLALQADARFGFRPPDELSDATDGDEDTAEAAGGDGDGKDDDAKALPPIERAGLAGRLFEVPLAAGNYRALAAAGERLYLLDGDGDSASLKYLAIEPEPSLTEYAGKVERYALSADGKRVLIRRPGSGERDFGTLLLADTGTKLPDDLAKVTVRVDDWRLRIDPPQEWRQMFADAWRMHRDHFFDANLRGVDWAAVKARFQPLLERVADRAELDDLLAQMMAELGALHSQVVAGDVRRAEDGARPAGLGARFERVADGWRVAHIHRTEAELPSERGPLQAPGVDVRVDDVIVAVNGRDSADARDLADLLRDQAGQQVLLSVRRGRAAPRPQLVVPVDAAREERLRYGDWVHGNRAAVEAAGEGRIGYLHLFAMGPNDMAAFVREFYGQYDRDGLIIDVRRNRGGNIDSWVIEKLLRRAWAFWQRPVGLPYANMQQSFRGHLVVLVDPLTYSDGETFAAGVQRLELGPLIGTRSAGAGVWLSDGNALVDRGRARVAEFPQFGMDGSWLIEGVGVEPDIVVDNPPHASFNGQDAQLAAGIAWLQRRLREAPVAPMQPRPIPPLNAPIGDGGS